jgi:hypothetical protein
MPERKAFPTTPSLIPRAVSSKKTNAIYDAWQHIVSKYSARDLTVAADKFPAISGIASKIRKATHTEYLAGLWKGNLASDLLWSASPLTIGNAKSFKLDTWRAPSFSWASLDAAVTYTELDEEERDAFVSTLTLLTSSIVPKGLNPLGTLTNASITIRGPVINTTLCAEQNQDTWKYLLLIKGTSSIQVTPDCLLVDASFEDGTSGPKQKTVRRAQSSETLHDFKAPVLCLSVARYDNVLLGLVLGVSEQSSESWERIGTFAAGTEVMQNAREQELIMV